MFSVPRPQPVNKVAQARLKLVVLGEREVGKSSLVRRYIHNHFSPSYLRTLGTRVYHKPLEFRLSDHRLDVRAKLTIWDVMGDRGLEKVLKEVYFHGTHGILAVCDASRAETLHALGEWIEGAYAIAPQIRVHVVANKWDHKERVLGYDDLEYHARAQGMPHTPASARTGANVEKVFQGLAEGVVRHHLEDVLGRRPLSVPTAPGPTAATPSSPGPR